MIPLKKISLYNITQLMFLIVRIKSKYISSFFLLYDVYEYNNI